MARSYKAALRFLYSLQRFGIKLGLSNIRNLLRTLGEPHKGMPIIHIAGTNGKGSVAAFMSSMLQCQGYRVGIFTSPHLEDFRERIRINRQYIPPEAVVHYCDRIKSVLKENEALFSPADSVTFFEFVTAMAYLYFAEQKVELAVMEVGLGGRLDATNVAPSIISIITDIDYDHTDRLGSTLPEIAFEKCGIIKAGTPVVTSPQKAEAMAVIEEIAVQLGSPLTAGGRDYLWERRDYSIEGQTFDYTEAGREIRGLHIRLLGNHQVRNAATALSSCLRLSGAGYPLKEDALREGLKDTFWPGRFEVASLNPCLILDGAHNPAGASALSEAVKELFPHRRPFLVFGAMGDKDVAGMLSKLAPMAKCIVLTKPDMKRSADTQLLRQLSSQYGKETVIAEKVPHALSIALHGATPDDIILVTGSLFTVAEARASLKKGAGLPAVNITV